MSPPAFRSQVERTPKKNVSEDDNVIIPPQTPIRWAFGDLAAVLQCVCQCLFRGESYFLLPF